MTGEVPGPKGLLAGADRLGGRGRFVLRAGLGAVAPNPPDVPNAQMGPANARQGAFGAITLKDVVEQVPGRFDLA